MTGRSDAEQSGEGRRPRNVIDFSTADQIFRNGLRMAQTVASRMTFRQEILPSICAHARIGTVVEKQPRIGRLLEIMQRAKDRRVGNQSLSGESGWHDAITFAPTPPAPA